MQCSTASLLHPSEISLLLPWSISPCLAVQKDTQLRKDSCLILPRVLWNHQRWKEPHATHLAVAPHPSALEKMMRGPWADRRPRRLQQQLHAPQTHPHPALLSACHHFLSVNHLNIPRKRSNPYRKAPRTLSATEALEVSAFKWLLLS